MTDPIADMLTRIRNAQRVSKEEVLVPFSQLKSRLARILEKEGYVGAVEEVGEGTRKELRLRLKYESGDRPRIQGINRLSKPGRRFYVGHDEIPVVNSGMGIAVLSTSRGIMTDKEARSAGVGGELLCEVY